MSKTLLLLDTDVLIDLALDRKPHAEAAANLMDYLQSHPRTAYVAWHSMANFYYLLRPKKGKISTLEFLQDLSGFIEIAPVGTKEFKLALSLPGFSDFEDALQVASGIAAKVDAIVTRNGRHFANSPVPAISAAKALDALTKS